MYQSAIVAFHSGIFVWGSSRGHPSLVYTKKRDLVEQGPSVKSHEPMINHSEVKHVIETLEILGQNT